MSLASYNSKQLVILFKSVEELFKKKINKQRKVPWVAFLQNLRLYSTSREKPKKVKFQFYKKAMTGNIPTLHASCTAQYGKGFTAGG